MVSISSVSLFIVLGFVASSLTANLTVVRNIKLSIDKNCSTLDLNRCTSNAIKCCSELNALGTKLSRLRKLFIFFEKTSEIFILHTLLAFHDFTQLELHGDPHSKTTVVCNSRKNNSLGVGLKFTNVSHFIASDIIFKNCGYMHAHGKEKHLSSALVFENCENVRLTYITVEKSSGRGISVLNSRGNILFESCLFMNNSAKDNTHLGGGGMYVKTTLRLVEDKTSKSVYKILNCTFMYNKANTSNAYPGETIPHTFGQGGGLLIFLAVNSSHHHFTVSNCKFLHNRAVWGGGLHLFLTDSSHHNTLVVESSLFKGNEATTGGGGMVVYMLPRHYCLSENSISVHKSNFRENRAKAQGGGTIFYSSSSYGNCNTDINYLRFDSCNWYANVASHSGAIDITTRMTFMMSIQIVPVFSNCRIENHSIPSSKMTGNYEGKSVGKATFMAVDSFLIFEETIMFKHNSKTALYLVSSKVEIAPRTIATFSDNQGRSGGAIALINSFLLVGNYSLLNFTKNRAFQVGGAIYSEAQGEHELHRNSPSLSCFIHCNQCETVKLIFIKNRANYFETFDKGFSFGHSIFASSLRSCVRGRKGNQANVSVVLQDIANFSFVGSTPYNQVATFATAISLSKNPDTQVIPGKEFDVPVITTDSFDHKLHSSYKAFKTHSNGSVFIDPKYTYMPANKLKLYGDPGSECEITIERYGKQLIYLNLRITLTQCPPGYILKESEQKNEHTDEFSRRCACAQHYDNGSEAYRGISGCNDQRFRAYILHQYWVGYEESNNESDDNLFTSFCPRSFCSYNASSYRQWYYLPTLPNKYFLDKFICREGRTGKICGSCVSNYSVYFHSPNFLCKENKWCSLGWIFYFLSEVLTLMILFGVILRLNISFTSGTLNGFLFFAQIIDILSVSAVKHKSNYPFWTIIITKVSIFTYNFFNLNFFHLDSLSFCLWEGATTLDIIAIKYLTIVLAFLLVISVFIFMNFCSFGSLKHYSKKLQLRKSVIHGISTFLVTCFAQAVKITFHLFAPVFVMSKGERVSSYQVLYDGDVQLFGTEHLKYMIPGFLFFISVVVVPTFFLMCYPLGFQTLYKCGVSETKITRLQQIFCIIRLRPLFDSFQGCYKDRYRYFAGLYFIYRICFLASYSYSYGTNQFYIFAQVQASIMLLIHCLAHPYKQTIHNTLDTILITNIAAINGLSAYVHAKSKEPLSSSVSIASAVRSFLTGLPLIVLLVYTVVKVVLRLRNCRRKKANDKIQNDPDPVDIPFRMLDEDESCESTDERYNSESFMNSKTYTY